MSRPGFACAWAATALLCGCTESAVPTQTIVFVDAEDMVRARTAELRVRIDSAGDEKPSLDKRVPWGDRSQRLKLSIAPLEGDAKRTFTVTATALDRGGDSVASARLITGFVAGEKRFVVLVIEDDCIDPNTDCLAGDAGDTCHRGECVPANVPARRLGNERDDAPTSIMLLPPADPDPDGHMNGGAGGSDGMAGGGPPGGGDGGGSGVGGTRAGSGGSDPTAGTGGTGESASGTGGTGGTGGTAGDGESGQGGAGGQDPVGRVCPRNSICADVQLPDDFEGEATRVMIALYFAAPSMQPQYAYGVQEVTAIGAGDVVSVAQDFSDPVGEVAFNTGTFHPGIVVFKSERNLRPLEGVDYWYFTPARTVVGLGLALDLGTVRVELVPNADDAGTPGNDAAGVVACFEDELCSLDQNVCCVQPGSTNVCQPPTAACYQSTHPYVARCDGTEDCPTGEQCCGNTTQGFACAVACAKPRERTCHADEGCDDAVCRRPVFSDNYEYGFCDVDDSATPGDDRTGFVQCAGDTCEPGEFCCIYTNTCATVGCDGLAVTRGICDGPEDCWGSNCYLGDQGRCCGPGCNGLGETRVCHVDADCSGGQTCTPSGSCCTPGGGCVDDV